LYGGYPGTDTGDPGWMVWGYTAQLGGGLSATISAEERRMTQILRQESIGTTGGSIVPGGFPSSQANLTNAAGAVFPGNGAYGGFQMPDIVANLRINQAWGSAQVMGAVHQVNTNYYINGTTQANGHPSDKYGYALGAGLKVFVPMIGAGDYLQAQVTYAVGATRYAFMTPSTNWGKAEGVNQSFGVLSDAVYGGSVALGTATDLNLTTAFTVNAAYDHFWNKQWKTSLYGGYGEISYNTQANAIICTAAGFGAGAGNLAVATPGCNNDWSTWWIGSRTQWNVTPDTYLALDVLYQTHQSGSTPTGLLGGYTLSAANLTTVADTDNWAARFRVHRDFYP
jgi:hypothetical protein